VNTYFDCTPVPPKALIVYDQTWSVGGQQYFRVKFVGAFQLISYIACQGGGSPCTTAGNHEETRAYFTAYASYGTLSFSGSSALTKIALVQ
jgi:hypothetical protein